MGTYREHANKYKQRDALFQQKSDELELANQRITEMLECMSECFFTLDSNLRFTYVNNQTERTINITRDKLLGKCILDIYPTEKPNEWQIAYEKVLAEGVPLKGELFDTFSNKWFQVALYPSGDGGITGYFIDISEKIDREIERNRLVTELETANKSLESILHQLPAGVLVTDPAEGLIKANEEAARIYGLPLSASVSLPERIKAWRRPLFHLDGAPLKQNEYPLTRVFLNKEVVRNEEFLLQRSNGSEVILNISASPVLDKYNNIKAGIAILVDVTERKKLELEFVRLDRLNIIGEMAASISHEIRNPITTVRGYLQFFSKKVQYIEHQEQFQTMIEELDRANSIISEYLSLAKNKSISMKNGNLNNVLKALLPLMQADALRGGHSITLKTADIPDNCFDEKEVRQLVLNLVRNSIEAMPAGGTVTIATYLHKGKVVLAVEDTGTGIPKDVLDKLGTPFVTTKENGTGLGLAVCYRIAQRHMANVHARTSSEGTTFLISFPSLA